MTQENRSYAMVPELVVRDAKGALDWYRKALNADVTSEMADPQSGKILHAEMVVNGATLFVNDDFSEMSGEHPRNPEALGGSPVAIHLTIDDVDAAFQRAADAGAKVVQPLEDMFWGSRYGRFRDPFGHEWSMGTPSEPMSEEEMEEAARKAMS